MPRLFAFLRAINVGGHTVTMGKLRDLFESVGLAEVQTFIASGNVSFTSRAKPGPALERRIETQLHRALGYEVATFVRTGAELAAIARYRPFPEPQLRGAGALHVGFLAAPLAAATTRALLALQTDVDSFHANQREVYWLCTGRFSDSVVSGPRLEKTLKTPATFRNVRTIARLVTRYELAPA